jgi:hypothetical protein
MLQIVESVPDPMNTSTENAIFTPHPHFSDAINSAICQSDVHGGVELRNLAFGAIVEVTTRNHTYTVENQGNGEVLISGHPKYCPEPVLVRFHGSTWGTPMIRNRYIGREMRMEFFHPAFGVLLTSEVSEIRELPVPQTAQH